MPDFSAKIHQIQFRLGLHAPQTPLWSPLAGWVGTGCPLSKTSHSISAEAAPQTPLGSPLTGWVGAGCPLYPRTPPRSRPFGPQYSFFPRPHHLSPLNQKVKLPKCPRTPRYPLLNWYPHFLDKRYAPKWWWWWSMDERMSAAIASWRDINEHMQIGRLQRYA